MKYSMCLVLGALLVAMAPVPVLADAAGSTLTATLADIKGEVAVRQGAGAWQPVAVGRPLLAKEELFTGVDSEVTIRFSDGSSMTIRELTQIFINTLLLQSNHKDVAVQLKLGELNAQVQKEKIIDTNFEIQTPTATASVRGTEINEVSFHPARGMSTSLKTGALLVRSARGATMTRPNDRARVDGRGNVHGPQDVQRQRARGRIEPVGLTRREGDQIRRGNQPRPFPPRGNPDISRPEGGGPLTGRPPPPPQFSAQQPPSGGTLRTGR